MTTTINLTIEAGFTGHIDMPNLGTITVRPLHEPDPPSFSAADPDVAYLLGRYVRRNRHTSDLHDRMTARGYEFHAPPAGTDGELRAVYRGARHEITLYVNSRTARCYRTDAQPVAAGLPGAEPITDGIAFRYGGREGVEPALQAAVALADWADDETRAD